MLENKIILFYASAEQGWSLEGHISSNISGPAKKWCWIEMDWVGLN